MEGTLFPGAGTENAQGNTVSQGGFQAPQRILKAATQPGFPERGGDEEWTLKSPLK